jgi:sugar phosphate isomerase/epimerase
MKISLCNEVLREYSFEQQCRLARDLGFDGLEIAPFTLSDNPQLLEPSEIREYRRIAEDSGVQITGLHWLLVTPEGMSITSPDAEIREKTLDFMKFLVSLCAELGGEVLIHGSPQQRRIDPESNREEAEKNVLEIFVEVAEAAESAGVTYCIEPLTRKETNFINTLEEAAEWVTRVNRKSFRTMLDTKAAAGAESRSVPELIDDWIPRGFVAHVHLNDRNLRAPGQGNDRFSPVMKSLLMNQYKGIVSVEPFDYHPNGIAAAARSIGYLRGILEVIDS